jgi:integrase
MKALDADGTAVIIEAARDTNLFVPILLGVLCGMRRGEITALRWRSIDLERGQLSIVASTEQTRDGIREKCPKSGRGRTVAMPSLSSTNCGGIGCDRRKCQCRFNFPHLCRSKIPQAAGNGDQPAV